ncbi:GntR family transcriptional regulator [Salininema proteolyticum]|uniref:GntR family transcriptional regulator n=1 Tax=Salininema proteolyticum TaxID=1607685 RepID=A0ABV8U1H8_9ACTN
MFQEDVPIYRQIVDEIKQAIVRGSMRPGEKLMSTNEYAAFYKINPATVQKAFRELVDEGFIYKRRGIGMFIADDSADRLVERSKEEFFATVLPRLLDEARAVGIGVEDIVAYLRSHAEPVKEER